MTIESEKLLTTNAHHGLHHAPQQVDWKWVAISVSFTIASASFLWAWDQNAQMARITQALSDRHETLQTILATVQASANQQHNDNMATNQRIDNLQRQITQYLSTRDASGNANR